MTTPAAVARIEATSSESHGRTVSDRMELITVLMRRKDYETLRSQGGPRSDQIAMALRHYVTLMDREASAPDQTKYYRGMVAVATFQCAISKALLDEIRGLRGRTDLHVCEAIRRFLQ